MDSEADDIRQPSRRIADELTESVVRGELLPGDRLPSTTELMDRFGVANGTIQNAMRILKEVGLVYSIQGRGTFIRSDIDPEDFGESVTSSGSPLFQEILSRLDSIGDDITLINDRLTQLEGRESKE